MSLGGEQNGGKRDRALTLLSGCGGGQGAGRCGHGPAKGCRARHSARGADGLKREVMKTGGLRAVGGRVGGVWRGAGPPMGWCRPVGGT